MCRGWIRDAASTRATSGCSLERCKVCRIRISFFSSNFSHLCSSLSHPHTLWHSHTLILSRTLSDSLTLPHSLPHSLSLCWIAHGLITVLSCTCVSLVTGLSCSKKVRVWGEEKVKKKESKKERLKKKGREVFFLVKKQKKKKSFLK